MTNRIFIFTLLILTSFTIQAQIPNNLFNIVEDSPIKKVLITDLNNDDIKEIMVLRENDDIIVYFNINGVYYRDTYLEVDQPLFMGYDDLNGDGGSDLYYSAASFDGIKVKYGKVDDPYDYYPDLDKTSFGEDELTGIVDGAYILFKTGGNENAGLALISGDGNMYVYNTLSYSGFFLETMLVATIPVSGVPGQMTSAGSQDYGILSLTNLEESRIENYTLEGGIFDLAVTDTQYIESFSSPYGIAGKTLDDDKIELYITDRSTNSFISSPGNDPMIIDEDLQDPGKVYIFDVDGDGEKEAYVEDGKKVYRYDDLALRSARELFFEAAQPIKDMVIGDIDGDDLIDVIIIEEGSNEISILNHDVVGVADDKSVDIELYPNPSSDYLNIQAENVPSKVQVVDVRGNENIISVDQKRIDISHLPSGQYMLSFIQEGVTYSASFIKSHN